MTPLNADCGKILTVNDIKRITGTAIPSSSSRIKDVANPTVDSTGSVRCLYGVKAGKEQVRMRITQYKTAAAASQQIGVTAASEKDLGAKASTVDVGGREGQVLLRDGGLINVAYGNWTLALSTVNGVLKADKQDDQLRQLAQLALQRIIKTTK